MRKYGGGVKCPEFPDFFNLLGKVNFSFFLLFFFFFLWLCSSEGMVDKDQASWKKN